MFNGLTGAGANSAQQEARAQGRAIGATKTQQAPPSQKPPPAQSGSDALDTYKAIMGHRDSGFSKGFLG